MTSTEKADKYRQMSLYMSYYDCDFSIDLLNKALHNDENSNLLSA